MKQVFLRGALATALLVLAACSKPAVDFTLTLGGDIMLARKGEPLFCTQAAEINPWVELQNRGVLAAENSKVPDYFFTNLESPIGENDSTPNDMNLCSDPAQVRVLVQGGVDLVSLANNHRDDCSAKGVNATKKALEVKGIQSAAMGGEPSWIDIPGGKMAVIAAEDVTGSLDMQSLLTEISTARENAQVVVVAMHWGNEYQSGPDERQQVVAQQIADAGADVIWGHHPHVLQKMEWIKSADGRQVLVLYSLGNLLADQWMLEDAQRSALVRLSFKDEKINSIEIIPLEMEREGKYTNIPSSTDLREIIYERLGLEKLSTGKVEITLFSQVK